jgi:uncharacterized protein
MENNLNFSQQNVFGSKSNTRTFMTNVFAWMFLALALTSVAAFYFASDPSLMASLYNETGRTGLGYVVMFAPIGFVLALGMGFNRFSYSVVLTLFIAYALIMGISLSFILLVFTGASLFKTFAICSAMFGVMAVLGYTTNTDLTKFGSIIASIINFFMNSDAMGYVISFIGVVIFTGLTAYDVQKLKNIAEGNVYEGETTKKLVIMGALNLYLDFINLFLYLLRFFGDRK